MLDLKDYLETDAFLRNIKAEDSIKDTDPKWHGSGGGINQSMHRIARAVCTRTIQVDIAQMPDDIDAVEVGVVECGRCTEHGWNEPPLRYRVGPSTSQGGNSVKQRFERVY